MGNPARALVTRAPGPSRAAVVLAALLTLVVSRAGAHPIHTTLTEMELDAATHEMRISVRVYAEDFSAAVAIAHGQRPPLDWNVPEPLARAYVARTFLMATAEGRRIALDWRGMRRTGDLLWIYLRSPAPERIAGMYIVNGMLWEHFANQINIVQATFDGRRQSLYFAGGDKPKRFR